MDRKTKLKVFSKLLDAGYDSEAAIKDFSLKDMQKCDIRSDEIGVVIELQEAIKKNKVISFFADEKTKTVNGGEKTWQMKQ